jgi:hypothetical protein
MVLIETMALPFPLKPSDRRCSASTIGFIGQIVDDLAKGPSTIPKLSNLPAPDWAGAFIAPAKGQAGAGRFGAGQICRVQLSAWLNEGSS